MATSLLAFSEDEVCSLTGLTKWQLRYWDKRNFFSPEFVIDGRRVYSFRDLVGLRAIAPIRERISLQAIRRMSEELHTDYETPWSELKFFFAGDELVYAPSEADIKVSARSKGQEVIPIDLEEVSTRTMDAIERKRGMSSVGKISRQRDIMRNAPVLAGTRVTTEAIWDFHSEDYSVEEILREYPGLTKEDVEAAIEFEQERRRKAS